ncbi:unnamed protein product [Sphagnum balticum]
MIVQAGQLTGFEVTYGDTGLPVMATIHRITGSGLVFDSTVVMTEGSIPGSYWGFHTPPADQQNTYYVEIHAYTSTSYATVNTNYLGSTRSYQAVTLSGGGGSSVVLVQGLKLVTGCQQQELQRPVIVAQNSDMGILISFFDECNNQVNITSATGIAMSFLESDNMTVLIKSLGSGIALVSGTINQVLVSMLASDFALLPTGDNDAQVELVLSGLTYNFNLYSAINVQPSPLVAI